MKYTFLRPSRDITRVFLHCSASDRPEHDNVETIRQWHTDPVPKGRGWRDVGYHLFIRKTGLVEHGRDLEVVPAAQKGHNAHSIAICLSGLHDFRERQFDTLYDICQQIHAQLPLVTFHGHCEVTPWKTCPNFDYEDVLGLDSKGRLT